MKIIFAYNKEKDIWCLENYGKSSMNSNINTKSYIKLIESFGEKYTRENIEQFIDIFLSENKISISEKITSFQTDWNTIDSEYHKKAETVFGVLLDENITAFLTVNNRCPYNIPSNNFFVFLATNSPNKTVMHELWHFYTWKKFGIDEEKVGKEKYNEVKESLTVLLNEIYSDLLDGVEDVGYPQHREMREEILQMWRGGSKIDKIWNHFIS